MDPVVSVSITLSWPAPGHSLYWDVTLPERLVNAVVGHLVTLPLEHPVGDVKVITRSRYPS